jgi:TRAP-type C4-dicarboxylate transport system permease large subunit
MYAPKKLIVLLLASGLIPVVSGCALAVGAAAGGTAVYILKDKGYEVQAPVTKK